MFADLEFISKLKNKVYFHEIKSRSYKLCGLYMTPSTRAILKNIKGEMDFISNKNHATG